MAFLIRSADGRTTICTPSAEAAAAHVARLKQDGMDAKVTDINGVSYEM